jgi:hypothetical protein
MRIAHHELHELSFELDLLGDVVSGRVRMVRVRSGACDQCHADDEKKRSHHFFS